MRTLFIFIGICIFLLLKDVGNVQAAAITCSNSKPTVELADYKTTADNSTEDYDVNNKNRGRNKNSLNQLIHNIQCSLEKAKPWVAEMQQEANRLEEAAKLLGLGILNSFGQFVDKLVEETAEIPTDLENNSTITSENSANSTEIPNEEISQYLCPEGFIANHIGICELIE